jgi:hypothetical protein
MHNYLCKKCKTLLQSQGHSPNSSGCPSGGTHSWVNLGETGDKNYQCKKCATLIKTKSSPNSTGCPSGSTHTWIKL